MIKLGQILPLHPTSTAGHCLLGASAADTNCLSFFTWSNLDRFRPCTQLPVSFEVIKLGQIMPLSLRSTACHSSHGQTWTGCAPAADTNCLSFFTWSNLDRLRPCNRHELPVIVHTINSEPLQLTSTACHFAHDQTQSQCSRHQLPVILHMTKLGQLASLQKAPLVGKCAVTFYEPCCSSAAHCSRQAWCSAILNCSKVS